MLYIPYSHRHELRNELSVSPTQIKNTRNYETFGDTEDNDFIKFTKQL